MDEEEDGGLAAAKQRKLQKLVEQQRQMQEMEAQKKALLSQMLDANAYERAMMVAHSSPQTYEKLVMVLAQLYQSGRMKGKITEEQLRQILAKMTQKREGSISFQRK